MFSPDGTLISASAAPHCGGTAQGNKEPERKIMHLLWGAADVEVEGICFMLQVELRSLFTLEGIDFVLQIELCAFYLLGGSSLCCCVPCMSSVVIFPFVG